MTRVGFRKLMASDALTWAEKRYIQDVQFKLGGSFTMALFEAIARGDSWHRKLLAKGFPEEVAAYLAWKEGDLFERASRIAGGDCTRIEDAPPVPSPNVPSY